MNCNCWLRESIILDEYLEMSKTTDLLLLPEVLMNYLFLCQNNFTDLIPVHLDLSGMQRSSSGQQNI